MSPRHKIAPPNLTEDFLKRYQHNTAHNANTSRINRSTVLDEAYIKSIGDLLRQFTDVEQSISEIKNRIDDANAPGTEKTGTKDALAEEMQRLQQEFTRLQDKTGEALTAPVRFPSREAMEVSLVPSTYLQRLEEYRSDESRWFSFFGIFVGAIIGVFVNVATGGKFGVQVWILIGVFALVAVLIGSFGLQARRRGDRLRHDLMEQPIAHNSSEPV